ncbi:MAG: tape measure protein [Gammaproteobacteria bacterium]|nr:tape measure protein [Gammaproteobacteria bacterium]
MASRDHELLIQVKADIKRAVTDLKKLTGEVVKNGETTKRSGKNISFMARAVNELRTAVIGYISIKSVQYIIQQADAYNRLDIRVRTATKSTGDYAKVSQELTDISFRNGAALADNVSLFQNIARVAPELSATNEQVLILVNAINQLGTLSGASRTQLSDAMLQFSQGLSSGTFRAEELNSIIENTPEIASRIAKGMNLTVGEMRALVLEGKLASKDVFNSLLGQAKDINKEFAELPETIDRAGTRLNDSLGKYLSALDKTTGTTGVIASMMNYISEQLRFNTAHMVGDIKVLKQELAQSEANLANLDPSSRLYERLQTKVDNLKALIKKLEEAAKFKPPGKTNSADAGDNSRSGDNVLDKETEKEIARLYASTRTEMEALAIAQANLDRLFIAGKINLELYSRAMFDLLENTDSLEEKGTSVMDELTAATLGWGKAFTDTMVEMVQTGKADFNKLADAIVADILRIMIYQNMVRPMLESFGVIKPGTGGRVGLNHSGGLAGAGGTVRSGVSPMAFMGAPRHHSGGIAGLQPDEVPAILQRGEEVLTRDDPRHVANLRPGGSVRVEVVNSGSPKQASEATASMDISGQVISIILDDYHQGGPIRRVIDQSGNN